MLDEARTALADSHESELVEEENYLVQFATAAALIAIAEELQGIHEIMQWSDANERRVIEERAAASAPSFEDMQRWERENEEAHNELPY